MGIWHLPEKAKEKDWVGGKSNEQTLCVSCSTYVLWEALRVLLLSESETFAIGSEAGSISGNRMKLAPQLL